MLYVNSPATAKRRRRRWSAAPGCESLRGLGGVKNFFIASDPALNSEINTFPVGSHLVKFVPVRSTEDITDHDSIATLLLCVSGMSLYQHKSLEELRWEDYTRMAMTMQKKTSDCEHQKTLGIKNIAH